MFFIFPHVRMFFFIVISPPKYATLFHYLTVKDCKNSIVKIFYFYYRILQEIYRKFLKVKSNQSS